MSDIKLDTINDSVIIEGKETKFVDANVTINKKGISAPNINSNDLAQIPSLIRKSVEIEQRTNAIDSKMSENIQTLESKIQKLESKIEEISNHFNSHLKQEHGITVISEDEAKILIKDIYIGRKKARILVDAGFTLNDLAKQETEFIDFVVDSKADASTLKRLATEIGYADFIENDAPPKVRTSVKFTTVK